MSTDRQRRAWIALGSNIEPQRNTIRATALLRERSDVIAVASWWRSASVGDPSQPEYINTAVLIETTQSPADLKRGLLTEIETALGRERDPNNVNAARTIDLDLAIMDGCVGDFEGMTLPDPDILTRGFLAAPLAELTPDWVHPTDGRDLQTIADQLLGEQDITRVDSRSNAI